MKKLLLIFSIFLLIAPAYSLTLEGGVKKVEEAREYVFKYVPVKMIDPTPYKVYANTAPEGYRVDYSDGSYSVATGNKMYTYDNKNKLDIISIFDKNVFDYPRKQYRYAYPSGKLCSISYGVSEGNGYIFRPDGSLVGIWENGIYKEGNTIINNAKISSF